MGFPPTLSSFFLFSFLTIIIIPPPLANAQARFNCSFPGTCNSIIEYVTPNTTTLSAITTLFRVDNLLSLLGANNIPLSTPPTASLPSNRTIKIPFPCTCANGTGISNRPPLYKVVGGDGLYHIAADVFSGLVTYQQIQEANGIPDPNLILVGQELRIPLPCSCDEVDGEKVVHYGHIVANGETLDGIAREFNTDEKTLLTLNGLATSDDLKAKSLLDVPLKPCRSMVRNTSLDYPLLVPNGTYVFTAGGCVMCNCNAANNFTLQCGQFQRRPPQIRSSLWPTCPSMQCEGKDNLFIGNTTSSSCNRTTCAYAGYTDKTILKTLASDSVCPVSDNSAAKMILQGWRWRWSFLVIAVHLVLLYLGLFQ